MTTTYSPAPIRMSFGKLALAGVAFGVLFAPAFWFVMSWVAPQAPVGYPMLAILALISGASFAVLIGLFGNSRTVARQIAVELPAGETLVQQGFANHFRGIEARGGRLYLTERNLIFQPHRFNIQTGGVTIPRADIANASTCMTLGVIPNGLKITRRDGTTERFVISDRQEWVRRIMGKA